MVAITGAGISLAGGGITYGQLFSKTVLHGILGRDRFLRSYVKAMHSYKPTFSHYALRDLEAAGKLIGIITTNEDCMHTMAGSKNVAEIQGGFQINPGETNFDFYASMIYIYGAIAAIRMKPAGTLIIYRTPVGCIDFQYKPYFSLNDLNFSGR